MTYELKHIRGIPYYLHGTTVHTFELQGGQPSEHCIPIGTYHPDTDRVEYFPDWRERVEPRLDAFRSGLVSHARDAVRDAVIKPHKPRKAPRNPRKPSARAKNPASL